MCYDPGVEVWQKEPECASSGEPLWCSRSSVTSLTPRPPPLSARLSGERPITHSLPL